MSKIHRMPGDNFQGTPVVLMDRVVGITGAAITQATVTSIAYRVFEYANEQEAELNTNGTEIGTAGTLTKTDVVFDTLQTGGTWTYDTTGYNFRFTLPGTRRPTGGKWHRVEVTFIPSSGEAFPIVWIIETSALAGSRDE